MEVTQQDDFISHAVIGQSESISMGMSEDASLMHILSSALYTYPKLAAVREVICNGWDGHIIGDLLNTPLEITLDEGQFRVRDFGPGIPHDKIGPIYGTYGNSTKRKDSSQTGGFGLGSKAPFAYTDNFEVISCHEGTKTIYRVSKSSMEMGGKPSINKIVAMPTTESGITVTYSVKAQDFPEFLNLINEVVVLGGIPARINGKEPIEPLPLLESPTGYIINSVEGTLISRINVRYGNVVYPIPMNTGFEHEWRHVLSTMNKLWNNANIIFMAAPDSVSIAPNRESLNFTEGTVKTLRALLAQFSPQDIANCEKSVKQVIGHLANKHISSNDPTSTWGAIDSHIRLPVDQYKGAQHSTGPYAYTVRSARLNHLMSQREATIRGETVFQKRFDNAIRRKAFPDNGFAKKMRKALLKHMHLPGSVKRNSGQSLMTGVFHKFITRPLYDYLPQVDKLDADRLYVGRNDHGWGVPDLVRLKNYTVTNNRNAVNILQKRALIVRSKTIAKAYLNSRALDYGDGWVVYVVANHPDRRAEAEKMLTELGYTYEVQIPEPVVRDKASDDPDYVALERKATPKRKGYLTLAQSYDGTTYLLSTARENGSVAGLTDPIAWVTLENKSHHRGGEVFSSLKPEECHAVNKLWGDKIAVVTSTQATALEAKGITDVKTYILEHVDTELVKRPDFPRYLAFARSLEERRMQYGGVAGVAGVMGKMISHPSIMAELGIRFALSAETEMLITFFKNRGRSELPKAHVLAGKVKESPKFKEILRKIKESPWHDYLDMDHLASKLGYLSPDSEGTDVPYTILRNLLK